MKEKQLLELSGKSLVNAIIKIAETKVPKVFCSKYHKIILANIISDMHISMIHSRRANARTQYRNKFM